MSNYPAPSAQPLSVDDSWRQMRIAAALVPFGLEPQIAGRLWNMGYLTLGDLSEWWQTQPTSMISGIDHQQAREIDRTIDLFWRQWEEQHT